MKTIKLIISTVLTALITGNSILPFKNTVVAKPRAGDLTPYQSISSMEGISPDSMAYFKASNTETYDYFGGAVAMDGNILAIAATGEDSNAKGINWDETNNLAPESGAVYIFEKTGNTWIQTAYIKASNSDAYDNFGVSIALYGNTLVVGAPYEDSNAKGINGNQADNSMTKSGAAYVFTRNTTGNWVQQAYLKASNTDAEDTFGTNVAIYEDTIAVGAIGESGGSAGINGNENDNSAQYSGAVYVFTRTGDVWSQQAYIKASNPDVLDSFGVVSIYKDTLVVGAPMESSNSTGINGDQSNNLTSQSGAVYVFTRDGISWQQQAFIKSSNPELADWFGGSTSISGDTLLVGAIGEDSSAHTVNGDQTDNNTLDSGAAYVFKRDAGGWQQTHYIKASNPESRDYFGGPVSIDGDYIIVSAVLEDSNATRFNGDQNNNLAFNSGAAYIYYFDGSTWTQQVYLKASNTKDLGDFGSAVDVSHGSYVVGAIGERSNATGINGDETNNSAIQSGAAYIAFVSRIFSDVEIDYWAFNPIEKLYRAGITTGCSNDPLKYCPEDSVTRAQMAVFLEKGIHGSNVVIPNSNPTFLDTLNHWAQNWIEALKNDGITSGCGNSNYCPDQVVTRAQMAIFLLKAIHGPAYAPPPAYGDKYTDVPADYWAAAWIERLATEGITFGCGTGIYCPDDLVTRAQMAVFLVKAFKLP